MGIYNGPGVTASYRIPSGAANTYKQEIYRALAKVIARNPSLCAIPVDADTPNARFQKLPELRLEDVVSYHTLEESEMDGHDALDQFLQHQHSLKFTVTAPPSPYWRVMINQPTNDPGLLYISFIFHHAISDTQSAVVFHAHLEEALATGSSSDPDIDLTLKIGNITLLPPMNVAHPQPMTEAYKESLKSYRDPPGTWNGRPQCLPLVTRFKSHWFSASDSTALVALARSHGTTLTAVFQTLLASTLFTLLPEKYEYVVLDCAVSLRRFFGPTIDENSIGTYASTLPLLYRRSAFSWDEVQRTKEFLTETLARKGTDMPANRMRDMRDMVGVLNSRIGKHRGATMELSNVGLFKGTTEGKGRWKVESMLFSQSASAVGGAIKVGTVMGRDGRLTLGIACQEGIVEDEFSIEQFVEELVHGLKRICA